MSFSLIAICNVCGTTAPVSDEGELPVGWFSIAFKPGEGSSVPLVELDSLECLELYGNERLATQLRQQSEGRRIHVAQ